MTVSECLKEWLRDYENLDISDLLTDFIDAPEGCLALFKSPSKEERTFLNGSKDITEYYNFFARSSTQLDEKRVENQQMMEDLTEWITEKAFREDYPDLSKAGSLICENVEVNDAASITSQEDDNAIYQLTLAIQYLKER